MQHLRGGSSPPSDTQGLPTELPVSYRQNSGGDLFLSMAPGSDTGAGRVPAASWRAMALLRCCQPARACLAGRLAGGDRGVVAAGRVLAVGEVAGQAGPAAPCPVLSGAQDSHVGGFGRPGSTASPRGRDDPAGLRPLPPAEEISPAPGPPGHRTPRTGRVARRPGSTASPRGRDDPAGLRPLPPAEEISPAPGPPGHRTPRTGRVARRPGSTASPRGRDDPAGLRPLPPAEEISPAPGPPGHRTPRTGPAARRPGSTAQPMPQQMYGYLHALELLHH